MVETIHIHEDDWEMRNLYPIAARADADADVAEAIAAGERNRAADGVGWTDMHMIERPKISYVDVGLRVADAEAALAPIMPRVRRFYATVGSAIGSEQRDPYGSYQEDAWCFGLGPDCYVKLEVKGEFVERIWFDLRSGDQDVMLTLRKALRAIDGLAPSILADYFFDVVGEVGDQGFMAEYLSAHRDLNAAIEEEIAARAVAQDEAPVSPGILPRLLRVLRGR